MKHFLKIISIVLITGCGRPSPNLSEEKENILNTWIDWPAKAEAGDPGYYFTDDVVFMGPGGPTIKGKDGFLKMASNMQKIPGFKITWDEEPSYIEISKDGQMAYLFAKNKMTMTDSTGAIRSRTNQAIQVWKKDNEGNWKAAVNVMYPEMPNTTPQ